MMYIFAKFSTGVVISDAINEAMAHAKDWKVGIEFDFNDVRMSVTSDSHADNLLEYYTNQIQKISEQNETNQEKSKKVQKEITSLISKYDRETINKVLSNILPKKDIPQKPEWVFVSETYDKFGKYELYTAPEDKTRLVNWDSGIAYCEYIGGSMPTLGEHQFMYDTYSFGVELEHPYWTTTEVDESIALAFNSAQNCFINKHKNETCLVKPIKRVRTT